MITNLILFTYLAMVNPADPTHATRYPSGIKAVDSHVFGAPPSTTLPILALNKYLIDKDNNTISPGHYKVSVSQDEKYIVFFQNNKVMAVFNILKSKGLKTKPKINSIKADNFYNESMVLILKQNNKEYHAIIPIKIY